MHAAMSCTIRLRRPLRFAKYGFCTGVTLCLCSFRADVLYLPEEVDWIKFNVDMSGYYMVHYTGQGWDSITRLLQHNHTALSSNDRASLVHNIFQLVRCVHRPQGVATERDAETKSGFQSGWKCRI